MPKHERDFTEQQCTWEPYNGQWNEDANIDPLHPFISDVTHCDFGVRVPDKDDRTKIANFVVALKAFIHSQDPACIPRFRVGTWRLPRKYLGAINVWLKREMLWGVNHRGRPHMITCSTGTGTNTADVGTAPLEQTACSQCCLCGGQVALVCSNCPMCYELPSNVKAVEEAAKKRSRYIPLKRDPNRR